MKFNGKEIKIIVGITTDEKIESEFFEKYFNENISFCQDEDNKYMATVFDSNINRKTLNELIFELASKNIYFEISVESDDEYIYERYKHFVNENYIIKYYVDENNPKNGREHLMNIIFDEKKIELKIDEFRTRNI